MSESLLIQVERARFERALEMTESMARHRVLLTTAELARINNTTLGKPVTEDPWRRESTDITLRSGRALTFSLHTDPVLSLREKLHRATELAEAGQIIDAAVDVYGGLVLSHFFKDANRRTAVLAAHFFLQRYGIPLSGLAIHEMGLGDLREEGQIDALRATLQNMAKFVTKK